MPTSRSIPPREGIMLGMQPDTTEILAFWFASPTGEIGGAAAKWFRRDAEFDAEIARRFMPQIEAAIRGEFDAWLERDGEDAVAMVVLLDQLPRNVFRDDARAFAGDARALRVCTHGLDRGIDRDWPWLHRYVFHMPLMHAEDRGLAQRSVAAFAALAAETKARGESHTITGLFDVALDFAKRHAVIVERFGRYPHRNAVLGRESTAEELAFLERPGSKF